MSAGITSRRIALSILPLVALLLAFAAVAQYRSGEAQRQREADRIGATYASDVATFRAEVVGMIAQHQGEPADELRDRLDEELATKPVLAPAPGGDDSRTYQEAKRMSVTLTPAECDMLAIAATLMERLSLPQQDDQSHVHENGLSTVNDA